MLKYWRIWLLLIVILGSVLAITLKPRENGVEIVYVTKDSPASGQLQQGMVISEVNGRAITSVADWDAYGATAKGDVRISASGRAYVFSVNGSIGIEVQPVDRLNINFGLDLRGGTRVILKPSTEATRETIEAVISTLQNRINIYGLREINFIPIETPDGWAVQIEATGIGDKVVQDLLASKGAFEAKVSKPVDMRDGRGALRLGSNSYDVTESNGTMTVDGNPVPENGTFVLEGITFEAGNATSSKIIFMATVYRGNDIELIYTDPQHSGIVPSGNFYRFYFTILVSNEGAQRFAKVTSGIPSQLDLDTGESYLKDSSIYLYLDNELQSSLRIASSLGGQAYATPQIEGGRDTLEEAAQEKVQLQTILRSGALPVSLETESISIISPTLGSNFIQSALLAGLLAAGAVILVIFVRYRSLRIGIPMVLTAFSEILIIIGISASGAFDSYIWTGVLLANVCLLSAVWWKLREYDAYTFIGALAIPMLGLLSWNMDLPAIGGVIASIGTGIDQMVIIADETLTGRKVVKKIYSLKDRIGRAFYIIFASAATTISALLPLFLVTAGVFIRGFVITTIIGILVGILITRPAYSKIVELSVGRKEPAK